MALRAGTTSSDYCSQSVILPVTVRHKCRTLQRETERAGKPFLPLPMGEVAPHIGGGEGNHTETLSVTCGDSSPKGGAKG